MRKALFNGSFYPYSKERIEELLQKFFEGKKKKGNAVAVIAPHAGYIYSGNVAAFSYAQLKDFEGTAVIIGPNHTGFGSLVAVSMQDWETPLGVVETNKELAKAIIKNSKFAREDELAHSQEHSIEVQLPFLQYVAKNFKIVAIAMLDQSLEKAKDLAQAIIKAEKETKEKIVLIASSDFDHYESAEVAKKKDEKVINEILKLNEEAFYERIFEEEDSICGYAPIACSILFAKEKKAKPVLLNYSNSGEATGDFDSVVAYCSIGFFV